MAYRRFPACRVELDAAGEGLAVLALSAMYHSLALDKGVRLLRCKRNAVHALPAEVVVLVEEY